MGRVPVRIDAQLEASLRRIAGALEHNRDQYARAVEEILAATGSALGARAQTRREEFTPRIAERHRRHDEQQRRRAERKRERRRERENPETELAQGIVLAVVAVVCLAFGLLRPQFFWMLFVALGMGMSAAATIGRAARRRRLEREGKVDVQGASPREAERPEARADERVAPAQAPPGPVDPKVARIQLLCDKLLTELESGPPIVREVVTEPRSTIAGLRQACVETARRESELRSVLAAQDESGLVAERAALATRLAAEQDPIVRDRLGQALAALEQQLVHRAALATTASRLEAENTRILYTVENLHMQLLRARSTDMGAPELGGKLRDSLRELGTQIEALAEALELADEPVAAGTADGQSSPPGQAIPGMTSPARPDVAPEPAGSTQRADAERAEREAAARRAARARDAQRH